MLPNASSPDQFLLSLGDRTRELSDVADVKAVTSKLLGCQLELGRAFFAEVAPPQMLIVEGAWCNGMPSPAEMYRMSDFSAAAINELCWGHTVRIDDVRSHPYTAGREHIITAQALIAAPVLREGDLVAVLVAETAAPRIWAESEVRLVANVADRAWVTIAKIRSDVALRESEARFRQIADNAPVVVWTSDATGAVTYLSRNWYEFTGQSPETGLGYGWLNAVHPDDRDQVAREDRIQSQAAGPYRLEYRVRRADGEYRWAIDTAAPHFDASGKFTGHIGSVVDIHSEKLREERIRFLLAEVNHRSRNLLAVAQAIAKQSAYPTETAAAFEARFSARLLGLAASQDLLVKHEWHGAPLDALIRAQLGSQVEMLGERIFVETCQPIMLDPPAVQAIGMALHELVTNAAKYGALSGDSGTVTIACHVKHVAGEDQLTIAWSEKGGPRVSPPGRMGFGHMVMVNVLEKQIKADVTLEYAPDGVRWLMRVPLAHVTTNGTAGVMAAQ